MSLAVECESTFLESKRGIFAVCAFVSEAGVPSSDVLNSGEILETGAIGAQANFTTPSLGAGD